MRKAVDQMSKNEREKHDEDWSREHYGQHFGRYPLLPYHDGATCIDMLHAFINEMNDILNEAIHSHLVEEHSEPELRTLQAEVRERVNKRIRGWKGEGGANLLLTFGETDGKSHVVNGPKLKTLLRDPTLLSDLVKLMRPLYELMEAKDHALVRPTRTNLDGMFDDAAAEKPAAEQTLAEMCAPAKKGAKKGKSKRGAHLNQPKAARPRIGAGAGVGVGAAQQREQEEQSEQAAAAQEAAQAGASGGDGEGSTGGANGGVAGAGCDTPCAVDKADSYYERASLMFLALAELWTFTHQNDMKSSDITLGLREKRAAEAAELGLELERAVLACVGTKRKRTYGHDIVYGLPKLIKLFGKPYLCATEGNESCHVEMKQVFRNMCSKSSKAYSAVHQCMDTMSEKRLLTAMVHSQLPRQARTASLTGGPSGAGHKEREKGRSDLTIEDCKENLAAMLPFEHRKAPLSAMDASWNELVAKKARAKEERARDGAGEAVGAAMDTES